MEKQMLIIIVFTLAITFTALTVRQIRKTLLTRPKV